MGLFLHSLDPQPPLACDEKFDATNTGRLPSPSGQSLSAASRQPKPEGMRMRFRHS